MVKDFVFDSMENFGISLLIFLIIWVCLTMLTFFKSLAFCKRPVTTSTLTNVGIGTPIPVVGTTKDTISDAIRITKTVSVFILILETALFVLMLILL